MSKWFREERITELSIDSSSRSERMSRTSLPEVLQGPAESRSTSAHGRSDEGDADWPELQKAFDDFGALFENLRPSERQRRWLAALATDPFARKGAAAIVILAVVGLYGGSWVAWGGRQATQLSDAASTLRSELGIGELQEQAPIKGLAATAASLREAFDPDRAMYAIVEEFDDDSSPLTANEDGPALHPATLRLDDYRFDFYTEMPEKSIGWTVRARDAHNYYAYRLTPAANDAAPYRLERWAVIDGQAEQPKPEPLAVPAEMIREGANMISVIARGGALTTLVNGFGVDFWREDKLASGGVGFLAEEDSPTAIQKMVVRGNDDGWGRILFSARRIYQELLAAAG